MVSEQANVKVTLNNEEAKRELEELHGEIKRLIDLKKKAEQEGDVKAYKKIDTNLKKVNREAKKYEQQLYYVEKALRDINGTSLGDLEKAKLGLIARLKLLTKGSKEWKNEVGNLNKVNSAIRKVKTEMGQWQSPMKKALGFAKGLLPAFGWTAIIAGAGKAFSSIFNLTKQIQGETIRSVTVLGGQMGYVENQADKLSEKMGVTNREFVSMVTNTADLLIPLDFSREKAAQMATQVQGLSGALDEWTAGKYGVAEVSNILTKAMLGEMEQLKGLGIAIRQDSEEFRDLVKQKKEAEGATDAQAKAMATLDLIFKKSADAQAAYILEGNKLLRFQKSLSLWWKQLKENIATGFAESMKSATQLYVDQQKKVNNLEKNLSPLIDQYEQLSAKKIPLTADEQQRLNGLISQIAIIAPGAITQFDEYGKAIGISTEKAKELIEAQKAMLLIQNADAIAENEKELKKVNSQMGVLETKLTHGVLSDFGEWQKLSAEETAELSRELENLGNKKKGIEGLLKTLKGEPLVDPGQAEDAANKIASLTDKQFKEAQKALDDANKEELNKFKAQLLNKKISQEDYNREAYILELSHLAAIRELHKQHGDDLSEIESKILDKKLEWQEHFKGMMDLSKDVSKDIAKDDKKMFEDIDKELDEYLTKYEEKLTKETEITIKAEEKKGKAREKAYEAQIKSSIEAGAAAVENAQTMEDAAKGVLNSIRNQIKAYIAEAVAVQALKALKSVPFPFNIIAATAAGATATLLFNNIIPEFYGGGYTGSGGKYEPAGIVHKNEWVAPDWMTQHPITGKVISSLESFRQNPQVVNGLSTTSLIMNTQIIKDAIGFAQGGYVGLNAKLFKAESGSNYLSAYTEKVDKLHNEILRELIGRTEGIIASNTNALNKNTDATIKFMKWEPTVYAEMIKKQLDEYDNMIANSRM